MENLLEEKTETAVWIAKSLFDRGKTSGSSANLSFLHRGIIYISGSGTCFVRLKPEEFSRVRLSDGEHIGGIKPSKELPLHRCFYKKDSSIQAVIHVHSFYSVVWSCMPPENTKLIIPRYTPYLAMKLGAVGWIPYAEPGSHDLFQLFENNINECNGYLLANHGAIAGGKDLLSAFYAIEEMEESLHVAWELRKENANRI